MNQFVRKQPVRNGMWKEPSQDLLLKLAKHKVSSSLKIQVIFPVSYLFQSPVWIENDHISLYIVIACKPLEKPYLSALLPKDQIFEDDEAAVHMQKQEEANAEAIKAAKLDQEKENSEIIDGQNNSLNESTTEPFMLENPFLRPVKMPFSKKKNSP